MLYLTLRRAKTGNNRATRSSIEYGNGVQPGLENGVVLRERRESMGVTIDEVETATKIRHKYLSALEADDWQLLPGEIVGRGFLRNYASFLDLDPNEMIERRRALADIGLARVLRDTSAVSPLPPERKVDYRPKEVELKDEPEGLDEIASQQRRRRRRSPFIGWLLLSVLLLGLLFWQASNIGSLFGSIANGVQSGVASIFASEPTSTSGGVTFTGGAQQADGEQSTGEQSTGEQSTGSQQAEGSSADGQPADAQAVVVGEVGQTNGEGSQVAAGQVAADGSTTTVVDSGASDSASGDGNSTGNDGAGGAGSDAGEVAAVPPTPVPPTAVPPTAVPPTPVPPTAVPPTLAPPTLAPPTPIPPTPVPPTPVPLPPTPVPAPPTPAPPTPVPAPVVVGPSCPDTRSLLTSPGINEVVSGSVPIVGSATHEAFQFYKLEFAAGANASGGYNYFDGTSAPIVNGRLGQLNTAAIPNGVYTIRLTTVDTSANFPPPCTVTIQIEN